MSILKSTNSGKLNIPLTLEYLLQKGWYYKNTEEGESVWSISIPLEIYKDDAHKIILLNNFEDNIMFLYYDYDKDKNFRFSFMLSTISDLDDLEEYFENSCIDYELALKKLALNKQAKNNIEQYVNTKNIVDNIKNQLTRTINNEIIKSMVKPKQRLDNCKMIWID